MTSLDPDNVEAEDVYFRCPNGHLGRIDDDQLNGDVSIVCEGNYGECDFHGYIDEGELLRRGSE